MFFSVIVPVYNVEKYLHECVDSILAQSFTDYEVLLVDDGSTDASPTVCDDYAKKDSRVCAIHNKNGGASAARNTGFKQAQGEYVLCIDSDDFFTDVDCFKKIHAATQDKDIVLFKYQKFFDEERHFGKCVFSYAGIAAEDTLSAVVDKLVNTDAFFGMAWMKCIRRQLIVDNDLYFKEGIVAEDIDWNYELYCCAQTIAVIDESFIAYRQRENSVTSALKIKTLTSLLYVLEKWAPQLDALSDKTLGSALMGSLAKHYSNMLIAYTRIKDKEKKQYILRVKALARLLPHARSQRPRLIGKIYRVFGFRATVMLVGILDRIR